MISGRWCATFLAILLVAGIGCADEDLLTGRADGNLDVRVEDDPLQGAVLRVGGGIDTVFASPRLRYSGVLKGTARLEISEDRRRFHDLGSRRIEVELQADDEAVAPEPQFEELVAPTGRYRVVRLTLRDATVRLDAGSVLRDTLLRGRVELEVGSIDRDREATIERVVESFRLAAGSEITLELDVNSHLWITRASVRQGRVSELALREATNIRVSGREDRSGSTGVR